MRAVSKIHACTASDLNILEFLYIYIYIFKRISSHIFSCHEKVRVISTSSPTQAQGRMMMMTSWAHQLWNENHQKPFTGHMVKRSQSQNKLHKHTAQPGAFLCFSSYKLWENLLPKCTHSISSIRNPTPLFLVQYENVVHRSVLCASAAIRGSPGVDGGHMQPNGAEHMCKCDHLLKPTHCHML